MRTKEIAAVLAELGNETRLSLFELLVRAGPPGLSVGEIQRELQIHASTLAFHLRGLAQVGLVEQERQGRMVICRARLDVLNDAMDYIRNECCRGQRTLAAPEAGARLGGA
ncbi:ArsR/SmtB family transcription factor [Salinarimonas sp.]|uniref:ArsR/SmtB family transcription factor n=1 Tax=Salinarimonas sp. TaxID=2766526 RepID=UPI00391DECFE